MSHAIVLFDGVCNLCNSSVQFIIKNDEEAYFRFASLQSGVAQEILGSNPGMVPVPDSIILKENDRLFTKSEAALRIARRLDGIWPFLYIFILIPTPIRDKIYDFIAANRYKWFGRQEQCMIPDPSLKARFIV